MDTENKHPDEVSDFDELHHEGEIPEFVKKYGGRILVFVAVFLVAVSALQLIKYNVSESQREKKERLASLVVEQDKMTVDAVNPDPEGEGSGPKKVYMVDDLVESLDTLAKQADGSDVGKMALLQKAEAIRSELVFADRFYSDDEKQAISESANGVYESLLKNYADDASVVGPALIAQGVLAEELGQWEQAAQYYQQAVDKADGVLKGTVFVQEAQDRLATLDDRKGTIDFVDPPAPVIESAPAEKDASADAEKPAEAPAESGPEIEVKPASDSQ